MKQIIFLLIIFSSLLTNCKGQNNKSVEENSNTHKPKTNIIVNKEYDEDGNLIKYDSTYSYYYSNIENDTILRDSIFNQFKSQFDEKYIFSNDPFFNNFFYEDSTFYNEFFTEDFFSHRFRDNIEQMNKLFLEMDSLKNHYFLKQFPFKHQEKQKTL